MTNKALLKVIRKTVSAHPIESQLRFDGGEDRMVKLVTAKSQYLVRLSQIENLGWKLECIGQR